jgi:ligand-binding SRPBCC domain-containing protein
VGSTEAEIVTRSRLDAAPADVWAWITTWAGINDELRPWLRMTAPRLVRERGLAELVVGERLCRSWILALGVIPIDYDDITVVRVDEGRGFLERSPMLSQSLWEHERTLEPADSRCLITDRVRYQPRGPIPARALRPVLAAIFRHRHRRLRRHFGGRPGPS